MKSLRRFLIIMALAVASSVAISWAVGVVSHRLRPLPRTTTSGTPTIGGPFSLEATDGKVVTDQTYRGKWLLIFFGYTFCPDVCPTALSNIGVALEKLGRDADRLQPLFVTVDPERDTRDVLADYLKSFDPRIVGLTGTKDQVDRVIHEYRIYVAQQKSETGGDDYLVSHSAYVYLMDPRGRFVNVIQGSEAGDEIAAWLRKEMSLSKHAEGELQ
ncbi:MAG: SCO family protein [Bradyrhizobium sp.]